jgi:glycosyltransferase involved in cell wall biosynthesis
VRTVGEPKRSILAVGASRGGVGGAFRRAVLELRGRGHEVEVVAVPVGRVPAVTAVVRAVAMRRTLASVATVHLEFGSNDIEVFWFALAAVLMRRDCVVVAHDYPKLAHVPASGLVPLSSRWMRALAYRVLSPALDAILVGLLIRRSGALVVFGEQARAAWLEKGAAHVEVIALGSDSPSERLPPPSRGESILFAGFVSAHKGIDALLEAWQQVNALVDLPLLIAGEAGSPDGDWIRELERRCSQLPNPPRFLGSVPDQRQFQGLVNRAAIVVLPYRFSSPASGVLVKAMSAGRAVIATPVPAASTAIVDGENGVLVAIDDPPSLAAAILDLYRSPQERDRLGAAAARTAVQLFTWTGHVDGLERAYGAAHLEGSER